MTKMKLLSVSLVFCAACAYADFFEAGRSLATNRSSRFTVQFGTVENIEGMVEETTRKFYDVTGNSWKQDTAESYNLDDFGFDDSYPALGIEYENGGKYFTFMIDATILNVSADAVARRNYYIGVGDGIEYGGREYKNLKVSEGMPFSMDLLAVLSDMRLMICPFTIKPSKNISISPWGTLSLMVFAGQYKIDAGTPTGTYVYMNPPETFVVGGESSGMVGLGLPEIGGGAEIRIGARDGFEVVIQGNYSMCSYDGSTGFLTSSKHREKNADIDHENILGRVMLEFPFGDGRAFTVGAQYQKIDTTALITSTATDSAEIQARRERFDKNVEFHFESTMLLVGLSF